MTFMATAITRLGRNKRRLVLGDQTLHEVVIWAKDVAGVDEVVDEVLLSPVELQAQESMVGRIAQKASLGVTEPNEPCLFYVTAPTKEQWPGNCKTMFVPRTWLVEACSGACGSNQFSIITEAVDTKPWPK